MGNDIEIRVRVANDTAGGVAAVNTSLNQLKTRANEAGNKLDSLATKAAMAAVSLEALKHAADGAGDSLRDLRSHADNAGSSMRGLRDGTNGTNNSLRTLNTRATTAHGRLGDLSDRTRTLRSDTDDLDGSMRRLTGTLGGLRGSLGTVRTSAGGGGAGGAMEKLKSAAIMLSPALIPVAASLVPIAAGAGAAGLAVGVFGAALLGQLVAVKNAADAQKKYEDAVKKSGAASKQATDAEAAFLAQVEGMDPATRRTAAALGVMKDQYSAWSKSLAGDTMPVATKGLAVLGSLMPRLTSTVRGASSQMDRFMTILAGGINSSGFEHFMDSFAKFSTGALSKANDGLVHFMRTLSEGSGANSGRLSEFMDYVRKAGPQVGDTLMNLSEALIHIVVAASDTGVTMLGFVNAVAKLVDAVPTGVLTTFLQFAIALKAVKMAAAGMAALGGLSTVATSIGAMRTAAAGASGPLAGLSAAFGTLSRSAKVALVGTAIGVLVIALTRLSSIGKSAPPDVDRMTTAIGKLGDSGKVSGEALRVYGKDLGGLADSLRTLSRPSNLDKTQQFLTSLVGMDSTPVSKAKEDLDAVDKSLASLVKGGKADLAKAAFNDVAKAMEKQGLSSKELRSKLDDYKSALADQALEAKLTAQSQGLFGDAAQKTAAKLNEQKQSADGLRGAIQALNDVQRAGLGGMIGFEAAIDNATKAARDNVGALSMTNGVLDLNGPKAQAAATALQDLADKTDAAGSSQREAGASWETVNGIYDRGRATLIKSAQAMGLSKDQATALAAQLLKIPTDVTSNVKMNAEDAKRDIASFNAAVRKSPDSKSVTLKALSKSGEQVLESFGLKVRRLPDGSVRVTTKGGALSAINNVAAALRRLNGKTATTWTYHNIRTNYSTSNSVSGGKSVHDMVGATGGLFTGKGGGFRYADGGPVRGPGTGTSDDVPAPWLSNGEFVIKKAAVDKYGETFLQRVNDGQFDGPHYARGGKVTKAQQRAKAQAQAEQQARNDARGQLTISHFGQKAGYRNSEIIGQLGSPDSMSSLVSALNSWRSTILKATHGSTESRLLKQLDSAGKSLLKYEKNLASVNKSLEKAKTKLDDLKSSATQLRDGVKSNVLSASNITRGAGGDAPVTVASIMSGATQSRDKAKSFAGALAALKKKGLDKGLIQDIANAGIDGGGLETAGALMNASSSEIKSLNSLRSQTSTYGKAAGTTAADAMYGAAIKSQEKLVKSLEKQQDKLEKAMSKLAHTIEKSIEKAFGKKANGGIVGGAASGGVRGGLTWVGEEGPELVRLPASSIVYPAGQSRQRAQAPWASMLNTPRGGSAAAPASPSGPSGSRPLVLNIALGGREFGQVWVDVGRNEVRTRGGLKATLGGLD
ncbi:phage tail protein [Streptomyces sp. NPDC005227]|uniref:phage tail protein n=1 Tax=Streptomyces sp. NPDC005227 TaxID=3364707 RepID=UPI00368B7F8C